MSKANNKVIVAVVIGDADSPFPNDYTAHNEGECRDSVDAMVFRLVMEMKDIITVGKTVGHPVWGVACN